MRRIVILVSTLLVLIVVNLAIYQKEQILAQGTTLFLELAPRDPRSLMQGDYMILRYKIANKPILQQVEQDGYLVIERDSKQVAHFKRLHNDTKPLQENELLLRFRKRRRGIRLGAESFFFQEGHAQYYENARYGELKVATSGESILVGLRDPQLNAIVPSDKIVAN